MIKVATNPQSLRDKLHVAAAAGAGALLRRMGARPLLGPALTLLDTCLSSRASIILSVAGIFNIEIPLSDAYWVAVALDGSYEPEVFELLDRLERRSTLFVDCGANVGWWSLMAEFRWNWPSVAVEPSSALVRRIEQARALNDAHVTILRKAVWKHDGQILKFKTGSRAHAGGHLGDVAGFVADLRVGEVEEVESITVDRIVSTCAKSGFERIVIKIDVEGAEAEAIAGARNAIDSGALLIFEDHGADRSCRTTAILLAMGLHVYAIEGGLRRVLTVAEARACKPSRRRGYNFAAGKPGTAASSDLERLAAPKPG